MREYVTRPVVKHASVITHVRCLCESSEYEITLEDGEKVFCNRDMVCRHTPVKGDYYVVDPADGFDYLNPKEVFERKHEEVVSSTIVSAFVEDGKPSFFDFGGALMLMKSGHKVARLGWNGKGMWISLSPGSNDLPAEKFWNPNNRKFAEENGGSADVLPCITMRTADGKILMGWLASQTDMLAEDWVIVE